MLIDIGCVANLAAITSQGTCLRTEFPCGQTGLCHVRLLLSPVRVASVCISLHETLAAPLSINMFPVKTDNPDQELNPSRDLQSSQNGSSRTTRPTDQVGAGRSCFTGSLISLVLNPSEDIEHLFKKQLGAVFYMHVLCDVST